MLSKSQHNNLVDTVNWIEFNNSMNPIVRITKKLNSQYDLISSHSNGNRIWEVRLKKKKNKNKKKKLTHKGKLASRLRLNLQMEYH